MSNTTRNTRNTLTVKVLKDYDGGTTTFTVVETIVRKGTTVGGTNGSRVSPYGRNRRTTVSYKGQRHLTFRLPSCYGEAAGLCIAVK